MLPASGSTHPLLLVAVLRRTSSRPPDRCPARYLLHDDPRLVLQGHDVESLTEVGLADGRLQGLVHRPELRGGQVDAAAAEATAPALLVGDACAVGG